MLEVYHHPICPFSRKLRVTLNEKKVQYELLNEKYWERRTEFLILNPTGETPVIIKPGNIVIAGQTAIFEYFEEVIPEINLLGESPLERAKTRKIIEWFDNKFYTEVTRHLINEKFIKVVTRTSEPSSNSIRAAKKNILYHLDYIAYLLGDNDYLCGEKLTLADISAASQLSVLDFIGDVPWDRVHNKVKDWYSLMKSKPSFRSILLDKIPGFNPPSYYSNPDF